MTVRARIHVHKYIAVRCVGPDKEIRTTNSFLHTTLRPDYYSRHSFPLSGFVIRFFNTYILTLRENFSTRSYYKKKSPKLLAICNVCEPLDPRCYLKR